MSDATSAPADSPPDDPERSRTVGEYTWADFMREHGFEEAASRIDRDANSDDRGGPGRGLFRRGETGASGSTARDWAAVNFEPADWLGFPPRELDPRLDEGAERAATLRRGFARWIAATPVRKDDYTWEHFKWEYHYEDGDPPRDRAGNPEPFDPAEYLGFDPGETEDRLEEAAEDAAALRGLVARRTVNVNPDLDEDDFFSDAEGHTTLVNRYDLEKAVDMEKKGHFVEVERYWTDKPHTFVVIFYSLRENERKYYLISPHRNEIERSLMEFLSKKLRTAIKYSEEDLVVRGDDADRRTILERETRRLLDRYDLYETDRSALTDLVDQVGRILGVGDGWSPGDGEDPGQLEGIEARPEPVVLDEEADQLTQYQVQKLLYYLKRNFLGYERIDGIKYDINVEDISCDGYNSPVFVYHTDYENLITNIEHGEQSLDDFVVKFAQRSGKGISQRRPQVDATLPDGSRAQLTLGKGVSGHGTNYTIRQFKDVPFTPVDLINWGTFSLEQMGYLWLAIENERSLIFAGGTASGKTTSLNACSLFIPSNTKIVSIEDTREVELPQRNWVASVTRPAFGTSDKGSVDEFDLLEAALRQRPDYIVMGEVRGEEGRTLFQVMSTGHTTLTTFHADDVSEVLKRFTTDPINVSKTLFTSLDLVSVQTQTRVRGRKVRRSKALTEINRYDAENDEVNVQDVYQWEPETDEMQSLARSNTLQDIRFDRGWDQDRLERALLTRQAVLAYLVVNGYNTYADVAATLQAFMNDPEAILTMVANDRLKRHLGELQQMESVLIDVDPEKERLVPRPDPDDETYATAEAVLERAESRIFEEYRGREARSLASVLADVTEGGVEDVVAEPGGGERLREMFDEDLLTAQAVETDPTGASADTDGEATTAMTNGDGIGREDTATDSSSGDGATDAGDRDRNRGSDR